MIIGQTPVEERIVYVMAKVTKEDCLTVDEAAREAGTTRQTLYTYMNVLGVQKYGFPFDRKTYILKEDVEKIKELIAQNR